MEDIDKYQYTHPVCRSIHERLCDKIHDVGNDLRTIVNVMYQNIAKENTNEPGNH